MNAQLARIEADFRKAQSRLDRLVRDVPAERWSTRVAADRWSVADCVEHLNRTSEAFLPALDAALRASSGRRRRTGIHYRRDPLGWMLSVMMPPPVLVRVRTTAPFEPTAGITPAELVARFSELQEAQIQCVHQAHGLPLGEIWIESPFDPRARYNAYSCLVILPRHQHRHLWQAEQVAKQLGR